MRLRTPCVRATSLVRRFNGLPPPDRRCATGALAHDERGSEEDTDGKSAQRTVPMLGRSDPATQVGAMEPLGFSILQVLVKLAMRLDFAVCGQLRSSTGVLP